MKRMGNAMFRYAMTLMLILGSCATGLHASQPKTDFFVNSMLYSLLIHGDSTSELSMSIYKCNGKYYLHSIFNKRDKSILQVLYELDKIGHIVSRQEVAILHEVNGEMYIGKSRCEVIKYHIAIRYEDIVPSGSLKK